jgi:hypothetical protein
MPGDPGMPPGMGGFPGDPMFAQPKVKQKVLKSEWNVLHELEQSIVFDSTIEGLVLVHSGDFAGQLKRTYSGEASGQNLCPS